jgi:hypothetical protein
MASRAALRALSPQQRAERRRDLALAAELLRHQIGAELVRLQPSAERLLFGVDLALWLRRQWRQRSPLERRVAAVLALLGGLAGIGGVGGFALRRRRWIRNAIIAWRAWRHLLR